MTHPGFHPRGRNQLPHRDIIRLAIIVGHNHKAQGAIRKDTGETEFSWNSRLAVAIQALAEAAYPGIKVRVFFRKPGGGTEKEIRRVYRDTDIWGADATVELHFNSHHLESATGSEVLSSGTKGSLILAEHIQDEFLEALGLKDRGVKIVKKGRGRLSLISGRAPAVVSEPFFGSSPLGLAATNEAKEMRLVARAILRGTQAAFA